jgi:hypothetical protein
MLLYVEAVHVESQSVAPSSMLELEHRCARLTLLSRC